jgi:hypothetical protein
LSPLPVFIGLNGLKAISGMAHLQGRQPVAIFYPFGHPTVQLTLMTPYGHPQGLLETVTFDKKIAENQKNLKS